MTNRSCVKDPHILAQKQPKMAIFEKADYWGLKDPLEVRVQHKTLVLYAGHLFQPFRTKKSLPGRQEGPKTAKMGVFLYIQKYPIFCCFWAKNWGSFTWERLVEMNFF